MDVIMLRFIRLFATYKRSLPLFMHVLCQDPLTEEVQCVMWSYGGLKFMKTAHRIRNNFVKQR